MVSFPDRLLVLILVYFCRSLRKKLGEYVETHITTMFSPFSFRIFPPKLFSVCSMLVSKLNENCIKGCYCFLHKYPSVFLTLVSYYSVYFENEKEEKEKKDNNGQTPRDRALSKRRERRNNEREKAAESKARNRKSREVELKELNKLEKKRYVRVIFYLK